MNQMLGILGHEVDLYWISYLYCVYTLKFSPEPNVKYLNILLSLGSQMNIEFDSYFRNLLRFHRIKKKVILQHPRMRSVIAKSQKYLANFMFFNENSDSFETVNILAGKALKKKEFKISFIVDSYVQRERIIFLHFIQAMAEIIHRQDPNYVDLNEPTNYNTT